MLTCRVCLALGTILLVLGGATSEAANLHVNNVFGSDAYDGMAEKPYEVLIGPFRTLRQALFRAHAGDTIIIANTGVPYRESLELFGPHHSANGAETFEIIGNGAILDGTAPVPRHAWKKHGGRVWKMTPYRKGSYMLFLGEEPLPEVPVEPGATELPDLAEGQWCAWRGSMYYRAAERELPAEQPFRFAKEGTGINMYRVDGVVISNLTVRGYRVDGIAAESLCSRIVLRGITAEHNGRAGIAILGTSDAAMIDCKLSENRRAGVLMSKYADLDVEAKDGETVPELVFEE